MTDRRCHRSETKALKYQAQGSEPGGWVLGRQSVPRLPTKAYTRCLLQARGQDGSAPRGGSDGRSGGLGERLRRLCAPTLSEVPAERLCCLRRWAGCSSGLAVGASARSPVRGAGWRGQGHSPGCAPGGAHALCSVRRAATHGHTLWLGAHGTVRARALCIDAGQLGVGVRAWAASTALANARVCVVVCEAPACVPRVVEPWLAARRLQRAATILAPSGKVASRRRT